MDSGKRPLSGKTITLIILYNSAKLRMQINISASADLAREFARDAQINRRYPKFFINR
jgi:hypothetical protein